MLPACWLPLDAFSSLCRRDDFLKREQMYKFNVKQTMLILVVDIKECTYVHTFLYKYYT